MRPELSFITNMVWDGQKSKVYFWGSNWESKVSEDSDSFFIQNPPETQHLRSFPQFCLKRQAKRRKFTLQYKQNKISCCWAKKKKKEKDTRDTPEAVKMPLFCSLMSQARNSVELSSLSLAPSPSLIFCSIT